MNPNGDRYYLELHQLLVPAPFDHRVLAGTGPRHRACRRSRVDRADGRFCECYISGGQSVQGPQQARHKVGGLKEVLKNDWLMMLCDESILLKITGRMKGSMELGGWEGFGKMEDEREGLAVMIRERYLSGFGNARVVAPWKPLYSCRRTKRGAQFSVFHETSIRSTIRKIK